MINASQKRNSNTYSRSSGPSSPSSGEEVMLVVVAVAVVVIVLRCVVLSDVPFPLAPYLPYYRYRYSLTPSYPPPLKLHPIPELLPYRPTASSPIASFISY